MSEGLERESSGPRISTPVMIGAWLVTALLFYAGLGAWLGYRIEGMDPSKLSVLPIVMSVVALAVSLTLTLQWARSPKSAPGSGQASSGDRRGFLLGLGAAVGGVAASGAGAFARVSGWTTVGSSILGTETPVSAPSPRKEWEGATVQSYRLLGRTGFRVSDISLGSGRIKGEDGERVARMAIDRGINYFDTAPDYSEAGSETALGKAIQGRRDQMFLATKFCTPQGNLPKGTSVADYIESVEGSLKRLQTDYVDLVHIHSCDDVGRLLDPNVHEAFDRLKQQGKVRFLGFSSHTPNLEAVAEASLVDNRFDVMMLAYHFGGWPGIPSIIDRAHAQNMGVVAMKTLKGAYHQGLLENRDDRDSYTQAAFKWVLSNPSVSCLVISFREPSNVDEYLYASGRSLETKDVALLGRYDEAVRGKHCLPHCGVCLDSCPEEVAIHDVLRYRMYFEGYGEQKEAMRLYQKAGSPASVCASCPAPCVGSCPVGIPIQEATTHTHDLLTLG